MKQNSLNANNIQQDNKQQTNLNITEKIIRKIWQTSHGNNAKSKDDFIKLEKTIKTQFDILNKKYLETWNLLHKIANEINRSLVIKKYQVDGKDFDLYEQEKKLLNVKMEIFYEVENKKYLTKEELEIIMGRSLEQINNIYNQLIELKNNYQEFEQIEIENQKNKIMDDISKKYAKSKKNKININKIIIIIFLVLTLLCAILLGLVVFFKYFY